MTRYARAEGSKSCNKKIPEEGTPWKKLKGRISTSSINNDHPDHCGETNEVESSNEEVEESPGTMSACGNKWTLIERDTPSSSTDIIQAGRKRKVGSSLDNDDSSEVFLPCLNNLGRNIPKSEVDRLTEMKNSMLDAGEDLTKINIAVNKEFTKLKKLVKKQEAKKCYLCQEEGHFMNGCPNRKDDDVCFICGSTEHKFRECRQKKTAHNKFAFATCFVCKERGHISTSCPRNPAGSLLFEGGCHKCGEVTHFIKDCPKLQKADSNSRIVTLPILSDDIEGLPEEKSINTVKPKKKVKLVKF